MTTNGPKDGWTRFLKLCAAIDSAKEMEKFFDLFLTLEEKETIASRTLIIKALLEGKLPQREISLKHQVSIAQITRGSNALKIIEPKLKELLKEKL